ncbi:uncharacterized protein LOC109726761 [Ananas comosus]|uniref:Uncharacterized protein LOC109726761 n=1 Tax=Ananas comosus TaxID=4615 RepID=A0A6P5H247_ANACO|nr:uncharacterized protein LOC109726761 [Ananas comosus]
MAEHLKVMSAMIRELKAAGCELTDEQQVQSVMRSLPDSSWDQIKIVLTHNEDLDLDFINNNNNSALLVSSDIVSDSIKWHARLGHIGQEKMARLARECLLGSLAKLSLPPCESCLAGKACRKPFGKACRATHPLELVHSDICRPMNVRARHDTYYFLTFIDDYSRYSSVYLLSHRSEALDYFKRFLVEVENQTERTLKVLRTDRGREYLSDQFIELCEKKGIRRQLTIPGYVMYGKHPDGGMTEIESRDVDFLENDFPDIGENEALRPHEEIAQNSGSGPMVSGSVPIDHGLQSPSLRRSRRGGVPRRQFEIEEESFMCASTDLDEPASYAEL